MAIWLQPLCDAIRLNQVGPIARAFLGLNLQDTVEAVSFTGPERLQSVLLYGPNIWPRPTPVSRSARANAEFVDIENVVRTVLAHWRIGSAQALPAEQVAAIRAAITRVGDLRRQSQRYRIDREVTRHLPQALANPPRLTPDDIVASAGRLGAEVAAVHAVASVESSGDGFLPDGRPKVRYEANYFRDDSNRLFSTSHPHLSCSYDEKASFRNWHQWSMLYEAMLLDASAALKAVSWGKFQIMGRNHSGWQDEFTYARDAFVSERNHLRSFEAFVRDNGLLPALRRNDFRAFALGYNGPRQQGYDTRMRTAYEAYRRRNR